MQGYFRTNLKTSELYATGNLKEKYQSTNILYNKNAKAVKILEESKINIPITLNTNVNLLKNQNYLDIRI